MGLGWERQIPGTWLWTPVPLLVCEVWGGGSTECCVFLRDSCTFYMSFSNHLPWSWSVMKCCLLVQRHGQPLTVQLSSGQTRYFMSNRFFKSMDGIVVLLIGWSIAPPLRSRWSHDESRWPWSPDFASSATSKCSLIQWNISLSTKDMGNRCNTIIFDIHGFQTINPSGFVDLDFSFVVTMRLTFVAWNEIPQQLLDGLLWNLFQIFISVSI